MQVINNFMHIKNTDRYSIAEAYTKVQECECQHATSKQNISDSSEERIDMILNNLVTLNNKTAELVKSIQSAVDSGEGVDEWASEKIAVAASMIGSVNDYFAKFNNNTFSKLDLEPSTAAINIPMNTNMPPMSISI